MPTNFLKCLVVVVVILVLIDTCGGGKVVKNKKRKVNKRSDVVKKTETAGKLYKNVTSSPEQGRGFASSILSLGRVFNFFPVGGERECKPAGDTISRTGICLNPYDCRQRDGRAGGDCAHGLGVCCVFEVTCGGKIENNLTYFMSPGFPEAWNEKGDCDVTIHKTHAGIMQLRIDFIQFTIGQPNRTTGVCDEDAMILGEGDSNFTLCGQNYAQHLYYTLPSGSEKREAGDLPDTKSTRLSIRLRSSEMPSIWLMRFAQMPLANSAPHDCLQYYTENNGTIKTFNYAYNGRHIAGHDYRACVRRNIGFCSVRYTPCDSRSFRIGGRNGASSSDPPVMEEGMMPADDVQTQEDEMEGSGADPNIAPSIAVENNAAAPGMLSRIWSFIFPSWLWGQSGRSWAGEEDLQDTLNKIARRQSQNTETGRRWNYGDSKEEDSRWNRRERRFDENNKWNQNNRKKDVKKKGTDEQSKTWKWNHWSPYAQHYSQGDDKLRYHGYGKYGAGLGGRYGRQRCRDRITIPCENEYFVSSPSFVPGVCDPHHCGDSFCPGVSFDQCRVETSITPFAVSVHFGQATPKRNPEENIGACIRYSQLPCDS
ncbi:uncharacterized protein LOC106137780 [Amyelois transitella]|uniref:uncharacterized protein LOC106137780 n=1 Tax=Amyelois transitella TaxID=680683 RepID=UPI00298F4726|nr:uncharacterized protein LOC106137780 [Amyelois transitella]